MFRQEHKTIFIDLDDTIVDTFGLLITPLEQEAARAICALDGIPFTAERLTAILLELRKQTPAKLRERLRELSKFDADRVLQARDRIFHDFSIDALKISAAVVAMIESLALDFNVVLVTEGEPKIQEAKVRHLGIRNLFDDVLIVDDFGETFKEVAIKEYMSARSIIPTNAIILGNRLDREILAGNRLGIPTVWIRSGQGSEMKLDGTHGKPNVEIDDICELPSAIRSLVR
jgi:putative hydrolase of the HAD superfamily